MAILFAGGEAEGFKMNGVNVLTGTTTSGRYDPTRSRGAVEVLLTDRASVDLVVGETEIWVHAAIAFNRAGAGDTNPFIVLIDSATGREVVRVFKNAGLNVCFSYWNGAAYQTVVGSFTVTEEQVYVFDLHLLIADTGGEIAVYVDQVLSASFSGDTLHSGFSQIDQVVFASDNTAGGIAGCFLSQVVIADEDTRGMSVRTLEVSGAGATNGWTDGDRTDIDEALTINDADRMTSDTADQVATFALGNHDITGYDVLGVSVVMRGKKAASGPQNMQAAVRVDGTDYFSGNLNEIEADLYGPQWNIWTLSPDTSSDWTQAELDALEAGMKSIT